MSSKGGRPNEIGEPTIRKNYNITVRQAEFIKDEARQAGVTESEIMRELIEYIRAQYERLGRIKHE